MLTGGGVSRSTLQRGGGVVDRLEAVLDESDRLMTEYPHLAAFERAIRADGADYLRRSDGKEIGFKALRDIISGWASRQAA